MKLLALCQPGFEKFLKAEFTALGAVCEESGIGWTVNHSGSQGDGEFSAMCFPHVLVREPVIIKGDSVNSSAASLVDWFLKSLGSERITESWPVEFSGPFQAEGISRRAKSVEKAFFEQLKKRMSRVAKLAADKKPKGVFRGKGLFVFFPDYHKMLVSRDIEYLGQQRMKFDSLAPSRSYLKVEEAYVVLGKGPVEGETVVDLGAAPGGWSYSAAKRGSKVLAVDNGPLKDGAKDNPQIVHLMEDAFKYTPEKPADWLFCDLVEEPHHVLRLIARWLSEKQCRNFVVNFKFGRAEPVKLISEVREVFSKYTAGFSVRHLYHDRDEFTVVG